MDYGQQVSEPHPEDYPWWQGLRPIALTWTLLALVLVSVLGLVATAIALYEIVATNSPQPLPFNQILNQIWLPFAFVATISLAGFLGAALVVLWMINRLSQRLNLLAKQATQAAAGEYDSTVDLSRIREIRELGLAFNHMINQMSSYRAGLQAYVVSVTDSQEEERKRIARDLHDGTIQALIAIGQRIELAREDLPAQSLVDSQAQLTEVKGMVTETIADVRRFSRDLRPLALEDLGLLPALNALITRLEAHAGLQARLNIEGDAIGLPSDLEITIFRLVQEALSNISKHAKASRVWVTVRFLSRQTIIEIRDDGVGFDVPGDTTDLARRGSFGLLGLEERASLFGGDLSIQSAVGEGSIIRVILPHQQLPRNRN